MTRDYGERASGCPVPRWYSLFLFLRCVFFPLLFVCLESQRGFFFSHVDFCLIWLAGSPQPLACGLFLQVSFIRPFVVGTSPSISRSAICHFLLYSTLLYPTYCELSLRARLIAGSPALLHSRAGGGGGGDGLWVWVAGELLLACCLSRSRSPQDSLVEYCRVHYMPRAHVPTYLVYGSLWPSSRSTLPHYITCIHSLARSFTLSLPPSLPHSLTRSLAHSRPHTHSHSHARSL